MATGPCDVPGQFNTPGQPDGSGGHRDLTTGVMDDFGKRQSQMVFQD